MIPDLQEAVKHARLGPLCPSSSLTPRRRLVQHQSRDADVGTTRRAVQSCQLNVLRVCLALRDFMTHADLGSHHTSSGSFFLRFYLFIFRQRGRGEGEKHRCVVVSRAPPTGDLAHNLGVYPDWELNQRPFGSHASAQSMEPHQPGPHHLFTSLYVQYGILEASSADTSGRGLG